MNAQTQKPSQQKSKIMKMENDDKEMDAAIKKAQEYLPQFVRVFLKHGDKPKILFTIKGKFTISEKAGEHMWLSKLALKDGVFEGTLDNEPDWIKTLHMGDRVDVKMQDVSDWMIIENKKIYGGFTTRVLISKMSRLQQKKFANFTGAFVEMD